MKVYIASRTSEREEVKRLNTLLSQKGFEVLDWTWHMPTKPYEEHKDIALQYSLEDVQMVKECDLFILLTTETSGSGSTTEFGMALFSYELFKKPNIYVVGSHINNMFFFHPGVKMVQTRDELLTILDAL